MAILVFMGWKLNILESVAITLAIGLSVDFTLHYAMMFKKGHNCEDQESAVIYSVTKMGGPVSMAAFTTIIPGLCMLPSRYVPTWILKKIPGTDTEALRFGS
jgi:predicted RND superfamily exporter protein